MSQRILYICSGRSFRQDAAIPKIDRVVAVWRKMGYDVTHVCGGDISPGQATAGPKELGNAGYHRRWYRRVKPLQPLWQTMSEYRDIGHDRRLLDYLLELGRENRPDVVVERASRLHGAGLAVARHFNVPFVHEWKDNIASYRWSGFGRAARRLEQRKLRQADYIIVESDVLRDRMIQRGVDEQRVLVAHNAADTDHFRPYLQSRREVRKQWRIADNEVVVGYLGSFAWYHNLTCLLEALACLHTRGELAFRTVLVGDGKERQAMERLAGQLNLDETQLLFRPAVSSDDVPTLLSALDVAVLPGSTDIICPIKIQEYMSCALPTVAPDYACNREVITDGATGRLFEPGDAESLAAVLRNLAGDAAHRTDLADAARKLVAERFTWEKTWGAALESIAPVARDRVTTDQESPMAVAIS